jgi:hypothetical protein
VGPKQFKTPDGTLHESITLDYQVEEMSDIPIDKLCVSYTGEDGRLNMRSDLTLKDVSSILKEWGY